MLKKAFAAAGIAAATLAMTSAPASAIGDSDGSTLSAQGAGGTNVTGTWGDNSPNFHFLDNPNICLPEVHHVQVGLIPVQADLPIADQQSHQTCNVGQATQGAGDAPLSHLIG
ncbi:rodlet layer protein [Streptacidiphilus sp. PB12-B1b]|uniref:rodlet layer protein n=1 Tax=Streptacidiphilus sp. PB12-B1b TaxID=2705012 RepID=UPI0015FB4C4A|nr:rodlet layer protein [Streptacidiphilus sp. PB12-B1b]QMU79513.1 rodlet layer protein [Streptacidiphilus sp. PB12-B1b]